MSLLDCNYCYSEWSTVVDISIPPPSFKPVSLSLLRSPLSKTPKHVIFNPINILTVFIILQGKETKIKKNPKEEKKLIQKVKVKRKKSMDLRLLRQRKFFTAAW